MREFCKIKRINHRFLLKYGVLARIFARSKNRAIFCWMMGLDIINLIFAGVYLIFLLKGIFLQEHKRSRLVKDIDSDIIFFIRKYFISISLKIKLSA